MLRDAQVVRVGDGGRVKGKGEDLAEGQKEKDEKKEYGGEPEQGTRKPRGTKGTEKFLPPCLCIFIMYWGNFIQVPLRLFHYLCPGFEPRITIGGNFSRGQYGGIFGDLGM